MYEVQLSHVENVYVTFLYTAAVVNWQLTHPETGAGQEGPM